MIRKTTVRKKRRNPGRYLVVIVVVIVIFGFVNSGRSVLEILDLSRLRANEEQARDEALRKRDALRTEVTRLQSDSLYIEEIARRDYGMVKPGEEVFNITLPDSTGRTGKHVSGK